MSNTIESQFAATIVVRALLQAAATEVGPGRRRAGRSSPASTSASVDEALQPDPAGQPLVRTQVVVLQVDAPSGGRRRLEPWRSR